MKYAFGSKAILLTSIGLTAALAAGSAAASQLVDQRGYAQCEDIVEREFRNAGLKLNRNYYLKRGETSRIYYLNGFVWDNNERELLAATCETTSNGREILAVETRIGTHIKIEEVAMR